MKLLVINKNSAQDPALEALMKVHLEQGDQVEQIELSPDAQTTELVLDALERADKVVCWGAP